MPDLCEMAARGDARLRELAADGPLTIAACYPRAVKWLFAAAGAQLPDRDVRIWNMRVEPADAVIDGAGPDRLRRRSRPPTVRSDARRCVRRGARAVSVAHARPIPGGPARGAGGGMSPADRATLARLLLERGLEVSCRHDAAVPPEREASGGATVLVGSFGDVVPEPMSGVRFVDAGGVDPATLAAAIERGPGAPSGGAPAAWKPWFPVIDYSRCTNCMQCLSFCLFDVYGVSAESKIQVQNQSNCKTECPACSRVCPEVAIMFPKYRHGPINGEEVRPTTSGGKR